MKKILYLLSAACLSLFVMMAVGCASTSEEPVETPAEVPAETEPVEEPVSEQPEEISEEVPDDTSVDESIDSLKARAEALRSECVAYQLDAFFPDLWVEAEASYTRGVEAYGVSYAEAEAGFSDAVEKYTALQSVALQAVEDAKTLLAEKKRAAEEAGVRGYYPEQFAMAEAVETEAFEAYESGDMKTAVAKYKDAVTYYSVLCDGMEIRDLRQKIIENNFDTLYADAYAEAEAQYSAAANAFGVDNENALKMSAQALASYKELCSAGFENLATQEKTRSDEMKKLCDSIKASRSLSKAYNEASGVYASAVSYGESGDWEAAYKTYRESSLYFAEIYQNVLYKKNAADEAMNAAKNRQDASTALALEADRIAPLPEGYEENEAGAGAGVSGSEIESGGGAVSYEGEEVHVGESSENTYAEETGSESGREYSVEDDADENLEVTE